MLTLRETLLEGFGGNSSRSPAKFANFGKENFKFLRKMVQIRQIFTMPLRDFLSLIEYTWKIENYKEHWDLGRAPEILFLTIKKSLIKTC